MRKAPDKTSFRDRVWRLFTGSPAPAARAAAPPKPLRPGVPGAKLNLVGLKDLRDQLGDRWPELAQRVHDLAEAVIQRHLVKGDVFDLHGEDGYLILFAHLSPMEARFKCHVIAKEIAAKLLGADWVGRSTLEGVTFDLGADCLVPPGLEVALDKAIARGSPMLPLDAPEAGATGSHAAPTQAVLRRPAMRASAYRPLTSSARPDLYSPVWDFGASALLRFRFNGGGAALDPLRQRSPGPVADADIDGLGKVLFDITRLAEHGRRLPVICPVALETVWREASRLRLMRRLDAAPPTIRKLVTLEIVIPSAAIVAAAAAISRIGVEATGNCAVRVTPDVDVGPPIDAGAIRWLNLQLPTTFRPNKQGLAHIERFAEWAERSGLPCGVMGLDSRPLVLAATAAGFLQLSGPAIHGDVSALGQALRFDLSTLYRDLIPKPVAESRP